MKCPGQDNEQIILVTDVLVTRTLPLAKGGGVSTAGQTVTQADLKEAHEGNAQLWTNPKGGVERYYVVRPMAVSVSEKAADGSITTLDAPEMPEELASAEFWYFPADLGRAGRGLTLPNGLSFAQAAKAAAKDAEEGNIPSEEAPAAAPAKPVAKPALAPKAPVAPALKAPVAPAAAVAKPVLALAKKPGLVLAKK